MTPPPPTTNLSDADQQLECQRALDMQVRQLIDGMTSIGWEPIVVFAALKDVVEMQRAAYNMDPDPSDDPNLITL